MASKQILSVAKKIIRKAAEVGLDQAGSLIMPTAWPFFKKILMPVVEELERRYPKMFLVGDEKAIIDSEKAIKALSKDSKLKKLLDEGFANLEHGQEQILDELDQIDEKLREIGGSIDRISEMTEDGFNQVLQALKEQRSEDASLEAIDIEEDVKKQMKRVGAPPAVAALIEISSAIGSFMKEVIETGKPNKTYKRDIAGIIKGQGKDARILREMTEYRATASAPYEDEYGRTCREITLTHLNDGKWISGTETFYFHRGQWIKV